VLVSGNGKLLEEEEGSKGRSVSYQNSSPVAIDLHKLEASALKVSSVSHIATIQGSYHNAAPRSLVSNTCNNFPISILYSTTSPTRIPAIHGLWCEVMNNRGGHITEGGHWVLDWT